jgi:hypothetical protein
VLAHSNTRAVAKEHVRATVEEMLKAVFSVQSLPRLHKESIMCCELVQLGSQSRIDSWSWKLEVSLAQELAAEGSYSYSRWSEYEVDVRWTPPCKDVSPEAEECLPLQGTTKQCDTEDTSLCVIVIPSIFTRTHDSISRESVMICLLTVDIQEVSYLK